MTEQNTTPSPKLAEFLAKINMSELPAMSSNVRELIALTQSSQSATYELSRVILKDYSLTNKVLQVVNSAFYGLGRKVSSISRAVTVLGFDAVRDLAMAVALFEDFIKAGLEREEISKVLTRSFVSAIQAQDLVVKRQIQVVPEEAFICALLHHLGKTIVCIYSPEIYREIERRVSGGENEKKVACELLDMDYQQLGEEIARFWNLSEQIIDSMEQNPAAPISSMDSMGMLRNMAAYSNEVVDAICSGGDLNQVIEKFGDIMPLDIHEVLESVHSSVRTSEDISDALRYGLNKLKLRSRLQLAEKEAKMAKSVRRKEAAGNGKAGQPASQGPEQEQESLVELPISKDKSINDFIHDMTDTLMGAFDINEFYVQLLEALYQGVGFDRVILAIIEIKGKKASLVGRFGLGDIAADKVSSFRHALQDMQLVVPMALKSGKDMAVPGDRQKAFPENLRSFVAGRHVYLFPIRLDKRPIGMIYLDRRNGRPQLDASRVKTVRLFRDFAVMAVRKIRQRHGG